MSQQQQWKTVIPPATQAIFKSKQTNSPESQKIQTWVYPILILALKHAVITKNAQDVGKKINDFCQQIPDSGYSWGLKGWYEAKEGNLKEAINYYQKAISLGDFPHWILLNQGLIYEKLNQRDNAINCYSQYQQKFDNNYLVYYRLGILLAIKNQWSKAQIYLEKSIKFNNLNNQIPELYHNLAWILLTQKKLENEDIKIRDIIGNYQQAIKLYSEHNSPYSTTLKKQLKVIGL